MAVWYTGSNSTASTSSTIWTTWCGGTTTATNCTDIWTGWVDNSSTTATSSRIIRTTSDTAWVVWNDDHTQVVTAPYTPPVVSPEEQARLNAEYEARTERYRVAAAIEKDLREKAEARAELLLIQNLSLEQRLELQRHNHFTVMGRRGYRFRIRRGRSGNVDMVKPDGTIEHRLCAHPNEFVPDPDTMLAQKIMLELDEDAFIRIANKHEVHNRQQRVLPVLQ